MTSMKSKQQGLTLVELMITLAVAIIMLAVGMPLFTGVASNNRAAAQTNALVTALNLARSEAVGRGTTVSVCPSSTNPPGATPACGGSGDWANGWFVFDDADGDGVFDNGADDRLRIWEAIGNPTVTTAAAALRFNYLGSAGATQTFQLEQYGAGGGTMRCVTLSLTGQIRTTNGSCS